LRAKGEPGGDSVSDEGLAKRAFCAARRACPAQEGALDHPQEILRTKAIGDVDGSSVLYSGDLVF